MRLRSLVLAACGLAVLSVCLLLLASSDRSARRPYVDSHPFAPTPGRAQPVGVQLCPTVRDAITGAPVLGAVLKATSGDVEIGPILDGCLDLPHAGAWIVTASCLGYRDGSAEVTVTARDACEIYLMPYHLQSLLIVSGYGPVPNARVTIDQLPTTTAMGTTVLQNPTELITDLDGVVTVRLLPGVMAVVKVNARGFLPHNDTFLPGDEKTIRLTAGACILIKPTGVTDADGDIEIRLESAQGDGTFRIVPLSLLRNPGPHTIDCGTVVPGPYTCRIVFGGETVIRTAITATAPITELAIDLGAIQSRACHEVTIETSGVPALDPVSVVLSPSAGSPKITVRSRLGSATTVSLEPGRYWVDAMSASGGLFRGSLDVPRREPLLVSIEPPPDVTVTMAFLPPHIADAPPTATFSLQRLVDADIGGRPPVASTCAAWPVVVGPLTLRPGTYVASLRSGDMAFETTVPVTSDAVQRITLDIFGLLTIDDGGGALDDGTVARLVQVGEETSGRQFCLPARTRRTHRISLSPGSWCVMLAASDRVLVSEVRVNPGESTILRVQDMQRFHYPRLRVEGDTAATQVALCEGLRPGTGWMTRAIAAGGVVETRGILPGIYRYRLPETEGTVALSLQRPAIIDCGPSASIGLITGLEASRVIVAAEGDGGACTVDAAVPAGGRTWRVPMRQPRILVAAHRACHTVCFLARSADVVPAPQEQTHLLPPLLIDGHLYRGPVRVFARTVEGCSIADAFGTQILIWDGPTDAPATVVAPVNTRLGLSIIATIPGGSYRAEIQLPNDGAPVCLRWIASLRTGK